MSAAEASFALAIPLPRQASPRDHLMIIWKFLILKDLVLSGVLFNRVHRKKEDLKIMTSNASICFPAGLTEKTRIKSKVGRGGITRASPRYLVADRRESPSRLFYGRKSARDRCCERYFVTSQAGLASQLAIQMPVQLAVRRRAHENPR